MRSMMLNQRPTFTPPHRIQSRVARSTRSQFLPRHNISTFTRTSTETLRGIPDNLQPQELHLRNRKSCPNRRGHLSSEPMFIRTRTLGVRKPWRA